MGEIELFLFINEVENDGGLVVLKMISGDRESLLDIISVSNYKLSAISDTVSKFEIFGENGEGFIFDLKVEELVTMEDDINKLIIPTGIKNTYLCIEKF